MKSKRRRMAAFVIGVALAVVTYLVYYVRGQTPPKREAQSSVREFVSQGEQAALHADLAGPALLAKLGDEHLTDKERATCALALGKLRYQPAIPKLIELVDLTVPDNDPLLSRNLVSEMPRLLDIFPCMHALVDYGALAVPAVVDAYLAVDDENRPLSLACVLINERNVKQNKTYLQGLLLENLDYRSKIKLLKLLPRLQERDKGPMYPP